MSDMRTRYNEVSMLIEDLHDKADDLHIMAEELEYRLCQSIGIVPSTDDDGNTTYSYFQVPGNYNTIEECISGVEIYERQNRNPNTLHGVSDAPSGVSS